MMLSILLLIRMHLYPEPFNGLSGNQCSRYRLCRISMRQSRNFESCDSETFRQPILMRWTKKLLAEISSSFMVDAWKLLNAVANLFQLVCLTQQLVFWRALRRQPFLDRLAVIPSRISLLKRRKPQKLRLFSSSVCCLLVYFAFWMAHSVLVTPLPEQMRY